MKIQQSNCYHVQNHRSRKESNHVVLEKKVSFSNIRQYVVSRVHQAKVTCSAMKMSLLRSVFAHLVARMMHQPNAIDNVHKTMSRTSENTALHLISVIHQVNKDSLGSSPLH